MEIFITFNNLSYYENFRINQTNYSNIIHYYNDNKKVYLTLFNYKYYIIIFNNTDDFNEINFKYYS